ncbi:family 20 glycosylhydrolase [Dyadobacter tibetensis]|uniref:family 20 glycosylhydrolase n=1 Tax=Dyadobacter tibetensis TaxID=1211851 RepID=UPI0004711750|nr:family 20 glycosylhydrolase [Dyadobacter tibetensis]
MQIFKGWIIVCLVLLASCTSPQKWSGAREISVSWKLISNFVEPEGSFQAQFTLANHGKLSLNDKNWALFFNMSPRPILPNSHSEPGSLEHINGDWYKLVPNTGFTLTSGDSITIKYHGTEGVIKEGDAPVGLYFVFYDEQGKEQEIVQVDKFTIAPFTQKEQILRGAMDLMKIPSPENRFADNALLSVLDKNQLQEIIPKPIRMRKGSGKFTLDEETKIYYQKGLQNEATILSSKLQEASGNIYSTQEGSGSGKGIRLTMEPLAVNKVDKEAYRLQVNDTGIKLAGSDAAGVFYGIQSLLQLIPLDILTSKGNPLSFPYVEIEDAPRFSFRSLHLDVARNFQTKASVLRILDLLATYKVNHILLYTTEDEGWRVEIDGLPELTEVGGQRQHVSGMDAPALQPGYGSGPVAYEKGKHGSGYYTKADFIEILKYAHKRHIKVIPELNFPGHALAAIKAMEARYERLMREGKEKEANEYRLIDPEDKSEYLSAQAYKNNVVNIARESSYHFFEKVVDEMAKLYQQAGLKMDTFHTGGDEVAQGAWSKSPMVAQLLKDHPEIGGEENLQAYFFSQLLPRLEKRNLKVHGWEEVALTKTSDGTYKVNPAFVGRPVVPYVWNNVYDVDLGNRLANAGYEVVLCNVTNFYFDMSYDNDPKEPGLYWAGFVNTRDNWLFAPYHMFRTTEETAMGKPMKEEFNGKELLKPEARKNIIGVEAQLWSETIKGRDMMEYAILPKLLGFAESAWAAERSWESVADPEQRSTMTQRGWNVFANSLAQQHIPRLSYLNGGYTYRLPMPGAKVESGLLYANVALPGLEIRYTTDGTEPTKTSALYRKPVPVSGTVRLRAFDSAGKGSRDSKLSVH